MATSYTFPKLIRNFRIEIPVIQRDYAQGRTGVKATEIRERFVADLASAITSNTRIHLDFIYGRVRGGEKDESRNKNVRAMKLLLSSVKQYASSLALGLEYDLDELDKNIRADRLILLDGQQRMTTLYLLYRYLAVRGNQSHLIDFSNFTYKTRKSSNLFCTHLDQLNVNDLNPKTQPSVSIINHKEFFDNWLHDPTVSGMLIVLDEIHKHFKDANPQDIKTYFQLANEENGPITFDFFDLDSINAEDELYVKMNARGRQLDKFENFKSWLIDHIKKESIIIAIANWDDHMDISWADIFWQKKLSPESVDAAQWNFFIRLAQYDLLRTLKTETTPVYRERRTLSNVLDIDTRDNIIPFSFFSTHQIFNTESINYVFKALRQLRGKGWEILDALLRINGAHTFIDPNLSFSSVLFSGKKLYSYSDRAFLYGILCFVVKYNKPLNAYEQEDKQAFCSWQRVIQNLIYNSRIDELPEYVSAIVSIDRLSKHYAAILQNLNNGSDVAYFAQGQVAEERLKASLILNYKIDEDVLLRYEQHFYLYGQIGFLLKRATVDRNFEQEYFVQLAERFQSYFTETNMDDPYRRLQRAFICYEDYLISKSSGRFSFCSNKRGNSRERDENWRAVFDKINVMNKFFEDSRKIDDLIKEEKTGLKDWRWYFANHASSISTCRQSLISWQEVSHDSPYIRLLTQSKLNHYHYELFSFTLSLNLTETYGYSCAPVPVKSSGETPYCKIGGFDLEQPTKNVYIRHTEDRFFQYSNNEHEWFDITNGQLQTVYPELFERIQNQIQKWKEFVHKKGSSKLLSLDILDDADSH
ncbi:GmrSD restriction endonuclease domain-containing protein [Pedobacter hartonius]|uniref:GmrSD restriction endonucleases N-terminal domain-containing protein n=1 Tax=Pedobacter hartonius TaxID=425514 RepID=A0A1H4HHU9_9SPHI|nr:DUF262 domain-containing protein [Pedobacter hartonius]SEB20608.1 Protein of unknown function DUF262 [Pedobacter hartonius]